MKLNSEALRELYQRETARSARGSSGDCLTEDMLARAGAGELDQAERERIADHLAICSDCAKEYRAISSLKSWADDLSADTGTRPVPMPASDNGKHRSIAVAPGSRPVSFYFPYAVAAAALVLSFALGALLISKSRENQRLVAEVNNRQSTTNSDAAEALAESRRLLEETTRRAEQESAARRVAEEELARRDAAEKSSSRTKQSSVAGQRPDVNVPIIDLNPQDAGRGVQNQNVATVQLPPETDLFTLILNLSGEDSSRDHSLEVTDRNNRTIWTARDLRKSPYNNFTVAMRQRSFPAGEYRLKIFGLRDGRRELIEEYAIRLTYR
ncbi:MAG TPA: zf-HC2 domain-containing protein [Pyrinomonadaceae bacterium]|nr:zf-HC2 domain-containing protein [Pyrinomonadaceae bacterium]